ncbi:tetratricopeptide repeat protein 32-like [Lytechinus variegatus]|uniref:tetratricopeptide repeat protein 32-like n=1 Tax=Lytechinus variegatus TaxID=7654 RepID=UPI001BB13520|nr:tetratricopeptide repeat protein 32-like [Lytechinus variegatus]
MTDNFIEANNYFTNGNLRMAEIKYSSFIDDSIHRLSTLEREDNELLLKVASALNDRGQIKYRRVDFDDAIEDYTLALQHKPDFSVAFYNRGQIHYRLGRFQEGISDFQKALAIQPDFPDCSLALQTAQADMKEKRSPALSSS